MDWKLKLAGSKDAPLYRRIDEAIRTAIAAGRLRPGDRIPSVVDIASDLKISKLTVLKAYRKLEQDGLLRSHVGRGTFVAGEGNGTLAAKDTAPENLNAGNPDQTRAIRRMREGYARGLRDLMSIQRRPGTLNLAGGMPSVETIPEGALAKLTRSVVAQDVRRLYSYSGPAGLPELREAISRMLMRNGATVSPEEIIVTNGSQQAIALVALWAREQDRAAVCETPTYAGVPGCLMLHGHAVQSIPWLNKGSSGAIDPEPLRAATAGRRTLVYVCPDFNNPTGLTMSGADRSAFAESLRGSDSAVLVDEIFRDMRFEGETPPSLYSIVPPGKRFLVGSISKSFMTGLRVGFLAADANLIAELLAYKRYMDLGGPPLIQALAAAFLNDGYVEHLERMRPWYLLRRDAAIAALKDFMPSGVTWTIPQGGFQLWVTLPAGYSAIQLFLQGIERGVAIAPGPAHDIDGRYMNSFRLGYGDAAPEQIREGVRKLGELAEALIARGPEEVPAAGRGILV